MASVSNFMVQTYLTILRILVVLIAGIVAIAVVFRYVFNQPLLFSFDLAVVLFVWLIFLGLTRAAHEGAHLAVDMLVTTLPAGAQRVLDIGMRLMMIAISIFVIVYGLDLTQRTRMEIASMRISMAWTYAAAPAGFALLTGYEIYALVQLLRGRPITRDNGGIL